MRNALVRASVLVAVLLLGGAAASYAPPATKWDGSRAYVSDRPVLLSEPNDAGSARYLRVTDGVVVQYDASSQQAVPVNVPTGAGSTACEPGWPCKSGATPASCAWVTNWWDPALVTGFSLPDFAYGECVSVRGHVDDERTSLQVQYRPALRLTKPQVTGATTKDITGTWDYRVGVAWLVGSAYHNGCDPHITPDCLTYLADPTNVLLPPDPQNDRANCSSQTRGQNVGNQAQYVECVWSASNPDAEGLTLPVPRGATGFEIHGWFTRYPVVGGEDPWPANILRCESWCLGL